MSASLQRRYPGLNYFREDQQRQFFGRADEIEELYALIQSEPIVALFGKSGYGKSSLLRAGILPLLDAGVTPVVVLLGAHQPGITPTPVQRTLDQLQTIPLNPDTAFLDALSPEPGLWQAFKRRQRTGHNRFLLLFDQFEEFETYPPEQKAEFKQQLAELLFTRIPQGVRDRMDELPDEQQSQLARPMEVKAVFAIREDRLSVLDALADKLPAILHKRFRLQGLTPAQAREAIEQPAALPKNDTFASPAFSYTGEAVEAILEGLRQQTGAQAGPNARVEAFLLQICCENLETGVIERAARGERDIRIGLADLPPFDQLFERYYRDKIGALPTEAQRHAARRMIEDELVRADAGGIAYRMNVDGRRLITLPGVTEALLKRLTDDFLLRSEPNTTGGFNYEVSHDTLVDGILKAKAEYEAELTRAAAEQAAREEAERLRREAEAREQQLAEAQARAKEEQRRAEEAERLKQEAESGRRRAALFSRIAGVVALAAVGLGIYAFLESRRAAEASKKAKIEAENATSALQKMEEANARRLKAEIAKYITAAGRMEKIGDRDMAVRILQDADALDSLNQSPEVDTLLKRLK